MAMRASRLEVTLATALETARTAARLSQDDFWFLYKQHGGTIGLAAFKNYLRGLSDPQWHEYDVMAEVLNEALGEERLPRIPFLRGSDGGLNSAPEDIAKGGYRTPLAEVIELSAAS